MKEEHPIVKTKESRNSLRQRLLKNRFKSLSVMAGVGAILAFIIYFLPCLLSSNANNSLFNNSLFNNLTFLFLSLPVLVLLWFYRTHDVQEQIDKAQSNVNTSLLNKGIDLLLTKDTRENNLVNSNVIKRSAGLIMLAKLRQQDATLRPEIDALTRGVDLADATFQYADLHGIQLSGANLENAKLIDADLSSAYLSHANLPNAHLFGADLSMADLSMADLSNTDLYKADLSNADLQNAQLQGANLRDAILSGADLRANNLYRAKLQDAKYNEYTKFPDGFNYEGAGMKLIEDE